MGCSVVVGLAVTCCFRAPVRRPSGSCSPRPPCDRAGGTITPIIAALSRQTLEDAWREYEEQLRSLGARTFTSALTLCGIAASAGDYRAGRIGRAQPKWARS